MGIGRFPRWRKLWSSIGFLPVQVIDMVDHPWSGASGCPSPALHLIQRSVSCVQQGSDGVCVARMPGNSNDDRKRRLFGFPCEKTTNPLSYQCGVGDACFRQYQGKLVAAVASRCVYGPAAIAEDPAEPAEGSVTREVAKAIVDLFQTVEVQQ